MPRRWLSCCAHHLSGRTAGNLRRHSAFYFSHRFSHHPVTRERMYASCLPAKHQRKRRPLTIVIIVIRLTWWLECIRCYINVYAPCRAVLPTDWMEWMHDAAASLPPHCSSRARFTIVPTQLRGSTTYQHRPNTHTHIRTINTRVNIDSTGWWAHACQIKW